MNENEWRTLCEAVGETAWLRDPRFITEQARRDNREALAMLLGALFQQRSAQSWEDLLQAKDVPCVVADGTWPDFLFGDGHGGQDQFTVQFEFPEVGKVTQSGMGVNLLSTPGRIGVPQTLGASTRSILQELGYASQDIDELKQRGVVHWATSDGPV